MRRWKNLFRLGVGLTLTALVLCLIVLAWRDERPHRLRISGGSADGRRHKLAQELAREAARKGVEISVIPTAGSENALDRVEAGNLELALVQGGLDTRQRSHLREVAPLHLEHLHLLVKKEIAQAVRDQLTELQGKVIEAGIEGSGTKVLATRVLNRLGITYTPSNLNPAALLESTDRTSLPDAIFQVSSLPSPLAQHLITRQRFQLVPVPFYEAMLIEHRDTTEEDPESRSGLLFAYDAEIPAFTYGQTPEAIRTIGTRLLLVARDTTDDEAVELLVETIYSAPFNHVAYPALNRELLSEPPEMRWHDGTLRFLDRRPASQQETVELINNQLGIAGAVMGVAFFFWQFLRRQWRRVRERGFEHYILRVARIERQSLDLELAATLDLKELLRLREELGRLKDEALERFAAGDLEGEELMTAFLGHVADTRDHLARLILHERDNIEEQARAQRRSTDSVWKETVQVPNSPMAPSTVPHSVTSDDVEGNHSG
jgi:TRAP transporter TAXI family solute receptor